MLMLLEDAIADKKTSRRENEGNQIVHVLIPGVCPLITYHVLQLTHMDLIKCQYQGSLSLARALVRQVNIMCFSTFDFFSTGIIYSRIYMQSHDAC